MQTGFVVCNWHVWKCMCAIYISLNAVLGERWITQTVEVAPAHKQTAPVSKALAQEPLTQAMCQGPYPLPPSQVHSILA